MATPGTRAIPASRRAARPVAGAAVAAGIGHIAHGTDIAGSIRYPAYACGVHGLRPTMGRVAAFNAALPERPIGPQISAVSGPLARTIGDIRIALAAMSARDYRDPCGCRAARGAAMPKRVAMCLNPDGLDPVPEVKAAVADAGKRLERAGWIVEEIANTPPLREPPISRQNSGSVTAMRRSWKPPSAKAIRAHWPACAATAQNSIRSTCRRR